MTGKTRQARTFTGRHMAAILISFFGVVIAVNLVMAWFATSTFGGLVVDNSYVASQKFNGWLEKAREEKALGWTLDAARGPGDRLAVTLGSDGAPLTDAHVTAHARHPLGRLPERILTFRAAGDGRYESREPLPAGRWIIHLRAEAHGQTLNRIVDLQ
ncbi:MAG: nitrogen fixation protein FixH [Sphingobium sp. 66-54]|nr:MAG: nitrogen fixation protein FixH [Sphingobium sp. 66-54]